MKSSRWLALLLLGYTGQVQAALSDIGTFCGTFPAQCQKGTVSLLGARGSGTNTMYVMEVDPTTGALPVSASFTPTYAGATGAAVPANASYTGLNNGGNLIGAVGDSSGRVIVAGGGTAGSAAGGVLSIQGVASMTAVKVDGSAVTQPVSGTVTANEGGAPWTVTGTGTAGSAAAGVVSIQGIASMTAVKVDNSGVTQPTNITQFGGNNVATGTGTGGNGIPRVTVSSDSTVGLVAGSAIIGNVRIDQTTPGTTNAVSATNLPTTVDTNVGLAGASTPRFTEAGRASTTTIVASNSNASLNITTSAYRQIIASTANAINVVCISDSSGSIIKMATGAALSEVDRIYLPAGGAGCFLINIPASTRISAEALDTNATAGYFLFTGY